MFIQYEKHSPDALGSFLTDVPLTSPAYLVFSYWGTHNSSLTYAWADCLQFSSIIFLGKISPYLNKREERRVMCQWAVCLCLRTSAVVSSCYCFRLTMNRLKLSSFTFEQVLVWECFTFPAVLGLGEKEPSMAKPMLRVLGIWASVLSGRFSAGCGSAGVPNCRAWFSFICLLFYHILQHLK